MEDRMGEDFSDVQIHTGPNAAQAAKSINARAFTVGNHVAFNRGEYDPSSPAGQHVIAHELAHVRQQTDGAVSMLPQEDVELEIDPDPELENEAEETAQRVMSVGTVGVQRLAEAAVHIQRKPQTPLDAFEDGDFSGEFLFPEVNAELNEDHPLDLEEHQEIPPTIGRDVTGTIRESVNFDDDENLTDRDNRNAAYAVVHTKETSFSVSAISADQEPGYTVPYMDEEKRTLEPNIPQMDDHSEIKLLDYILQQVGQDAEGEIYLFTEMAPCPSCDPAIKKFKNNEDINLDLTVSHDPRMEE